MDHFYTHTKLPIARTMNPDTLVVSGFIGTQPDTFIETDWVDNGTVQEVKIKADAEFQKLLPNTGNTKKVYTALLDAGNTEETARQISGYKGK